MKIIPLGSASAVPLQGRDTTCLAVRCREQLYCIDCGGSIVSKLLDLGIDPSNVKAIMLTHRHIDHIYGLPHYLQFLELQSRQDPLHIFGTTEVLGVVEETMAAYGSPIHDLPFHVSMTPVSRESPPFYLPQHNPVITVNAFGVNHGNLEAVGFRITHNESGKVLLYTGDTAPCESLNRAASGAHVIIHEATLGLTDEPQAVHSNVYQAAHLAAKCNSSALVLIHFGREPHGELQSLLSAIRKHYSGKVIFARDGETLTLQELVSI